MTSLSNDISNTGTVDNPRVPCLACGEILSWATSIWSIGPNHKRAHFTCACGQHTTIATMTTEILVEHIEQNAKLP